MSAILLVLAAICAAIAALLGFDVFSGAHVFGWAAASLFFGWVALLVGPIPARP